MGMGGSEGNARYDHACFMGDWQEQKARVFERHHMPSNC
jgi:hypothetical protein